MDIPGVILAGGKSARMGGGNKGLLPLAGQPVLRHVMDRLTPQVRRLAINANGDPARFRAYGVPVLADSVSDQPGPLAGILAAMDWAADLGADSVITVAGDTPFIPLDLVERLMQAGPLVMAASDSGVHPVCALWPVGLRDALRADLADGQRRVRAFARAHGAREALFEHTNGPDPFFNINTPDDLKQAQEWA